MRRRPPALAALLWLVAADAAHSAYATGTYIDNGVKGNPEVECGADSISLLFHTAQPYVGKVFVKGHAGEPGCFVQGDGRDSHRFAIRFDQCGVRRQRQLNGVSIVVTVVVSFHAIFITIVDRAYRLNCHYTEYARTMGQRLDVQDLATTELLAQPEPPQCRYEILSGGPDGDPTRYAKIGEKVYHRWSCYSPTHDIYCMRVHSCSVYDGQGGPNVPVLDQDGCEVDGFVLTNLEYTEDLVAGQEARVFKFADRNTLYFTCQLELTLKDQREGCKAIQPQCSIELQSTDYQSRSKSDEYLEEQQQQQQQVDASPQSVEYGRNNNNNNNNNGVFEAPPSGYGATYGTPSPPTRPMYPSYTTTTTVPAPPPPPAPPNPLHQQQKNYYVSDRSEGSSLTYNVQGGSADDEMLAYAARQGLVQGGSNSRESSSLVEEKPRPPAAIPPYTLYRPSVDDYTARQQQQQQQQPPPTRSSSRNKKREAVAARRRVADVDLPEQTLIVFGLDDDPTTGGSNANSTGFSPSSVSAVQQSACWTNSRLQALALLAGTLFAIIAVTCTFIIVRQRRMLRAALFAASGGAIKY